MPSPSAGSMEVLASIATSSSTQSTDCITPGGITTGGTFTGSTRTTAPPGLDSRPSYKKEQPMADMSPKTVVLGRN
ncbi:MAG TPA: hypothetical protein VEH06_10645 [Candidatus Bathyarchaeia archaeon]|nr:hypothetical protein [Candidatus Bathyarchaeia archaeon]